MAALQRDKVVSHLRVALTHLLKWKFSRFQRSERSWRTSLVNARVRASSVLEDSATLRNEAPALLARAYRGARSIAAAQMGFERRHDYQQLFPLDCPWTLDEVLNEDFFPELSPNANGRTT